MNQNHFTINKHEISADSSTYFIADIAANHDGDLEKAKALIYLAKEAGANAAKFQHFKAKTIVSDIGFKQLGGQFSHQKSWKKSVFEVYQDAEVPLQWTETLAQTCQDAGIDFFTSPYDIYDLDYINQYVPAFKVGSGDVTYHEIIEKMASYQKPLLIATGASGLNEITDIIDFVLPLNPQLVLMQCNTNYTANAENFRYINLNVLKTFALFFPQTILGLSDHTLGHATVLGAVALGAKVIEKHFTDNNLLEGPDHKFSMNPHMWKEMVLRTRELEAALGGVQKKIEDNEQETAILQRRCLRASKDIKCGEIITEESLIALRPAPRDSLPPYAMKKLIGTKALHDIPKENIITWRDIDNA